MIKNIIFDFDGTLADTSQLIVATMQKTIIELNLPYRNGDQIRSTIGIRLEEIPSRLWPKIENIAKKYADVYRMNFEKLKHEIKVELYPNVKETLESLKKNKINLAIATSRSHKSVEELLKQLDINNYFSYILGGDDVKEGKPNPESILKILKEKNWKEVETLMVGDMDVDILMGKNAGIRTCGVSYGNGTETDLKEAGATLIINDFSELNN